MFENLTEKLDGIFKKLKSRGRLDEENIKDSMKEIRMALLEADVNFRVVKDFVEDVRGEGRGAGSPREPHARAAGRQDRPRPPRGAHGRRGKPVAQALRPVPEPGHARRSSGLRQDDDGSQARPAHHGARPQDGACLPGRLSPCGHRAAQGPRRVPRGGRAAGGGYKGPRRDRSCGHGGCGKPGLRRPHRGYGGPPAHRRRDDGRAHSGSRPRQTRRRSCSWPMP